ncbi:MAG: hypothetical protein LBV13_00995 [Methanomassiliicoccaceae archaeon]|nr:hypothetical protein [Methanomassiliicoccaceae archaeon]
MILLSEQKKRRVMWGAALGAASGAALAAVLYFLSTPSLFYLIFVPIAAVMGAAQIYMGKEE